MEPRALIFDIKRDCSEDGPGIRTTVFFKGCPLSCAWCQNPEGITGKPGISFDKHKCHPATCHSPCVSVCSSDCITYNDSLRVDFSCCTRCDACFMQCKNKALEPVGYWTTADSLIQKVLIDEPFFRSSGGGISLSGGEATMQMDFLHVFLKKLKSRKIHTLLETCGLFNYTKFKRIILPNLDMIYFDLKIFDKVNSLKYTGISSIPILNNFSKLVRDATIPVVVRIPLVPGITATKENLTSLFLFLQKHNIKDCILIPFNPLYQDKLQKLGLSQDYHHPHYMSNAEELECIESIYHAHEQNSHEKRYVVVNKQL